MMDYLFAPDRWEWLWYKGSFKFLLDGLLVNIELALITMALSLTFGLFLALARISKNPVIKGPAGIWIDVWRNLPLIFILLYLALSLPGSWKQAYQEAAPTWFPEAFQNGRILAAILGLTLYNSAVIAEIMRAGIQSLEKGQGEAAAALGLPYWRSMRLIILPQGLRRMVPATVSQLITLNKDTTLISILSIQEVMRHGRILGSCLPFTCGVEVPLLQVFLVVGAMFAILNYGLSLLSRRLEVKQRETSGVEVEKVTGLEDQVALDTSTK